MRTTSNPRFLWPGLSLAAAAVLSLILVPALRSIFSSGYFMPHATCYLNNPGIIWLHVISDLSIGIAYMAISGGLAYLVYRARKDIPFEWMFVAFGIFIFSCGWTHFMEVWTVWHPVYWFSGAVKAITAVASVATGLGLPPLVPRVFALVEAAKASEQRKAALEKAHAELEEKNRRLSELDEMKTQFFANVSHELRTPLTLILGTAEKLGHASNINTEQHHDLQTLRRHGRILLKHVNDLLDASRLEAGRMDLAYREVDVAELVRVICSHFETLARDQHLEYTVQAAGPRMAEVDAEKIERILVNLLTNAFKFVPDHGKVRCSLRVQDDSLLMEVADSGPGIPPESREAIFERFRQLEGGPTRRFGGTGLGLAIVREFVELHYGRISVEQSPEGGALFKVVLPLKAPAGTHVNKTAHDATSETGANVQSALDELQIARPARAPEKAPTPSTHYPNGSGVVLVAEDNPDMNQMICRSLQQWGYSPVSAFDGAEGLATAQRCRPDLILSDVMMPGMSGEAFLQAIRAQPATADLPVVVLTARADDEMRVRLLRAGAQDYLTKPFATEELRARVDNLLSARKSRQELQRAYGELEAFSYSLAHDLRAPIRAIHGFATVLREDKKTGLGADGLEFVERITTAAHRMERLVQDILSYTKIVRAPMQLGCIELEPIVRAIIQGNVEFQPPRSNMEIASPLARVLGDQTSLIQCLANLLSNAVKYVAPGVHPRVRVSTERAGPRVRLCIQDNGIGIPREAYARIFDIFQRLHPASEYEGTGIGLAIVRKAAERMGGQAGVESQVGVGSKFWVELPAAD